MSSVRPAGSPTVDHPRMPLGKRDWLSIAGMSGFVLFLHLVGWGLLILVIAPQDLDVGTAGVFGVGLGVTAYTLGMRHAFDADHIAAIDNTTRNLINEGRRTYSVGFWFSLGHSSVVFGLCALLAMGIRALAEQVGSGSSALQSTLGLVGTSVSGVFLWIIGILNLIILVGIVRVFRRMRSGSLDEAALEDQLNNRGWMNRIFRRTTKVVRRPWQMYLVGLLFGLGFDTATEVSLLILAGGAAALALPWYAILTLPILFAAGMSLLDSVDGLFMTRAYGWALSRPVRKIYYNIVITALSVAAALVIGSVQLLSIIEERTDFNLGPLSLLGTLNLNNVGYAMVVAFLVAWLAALAVWRFGHIEQRWTPVPPRKDTPS